MMADFACASTKRTSHWPAPMSWEAPVRFARLCRASQRFFSPAVTPIRRSIPRRSRRPRSSPATTWTTILTIP